MYLPPPPPPSIAPQAFQNPAVKPAEKTILHTVERPVKPMVPADKYVNTEPPKPEFRTMKPPSESVPIAEEKAVQVPSSAVENNGRALLRLLEHGDGPTVEIDWPTKETERDRLYTILSACYGMRSAMMDRKGRLFIGKDHGIGRAGQPWDINLDRYSLFIRHVSGQPAPEEHLHKRKIVKFHGASLRGRIVRVFRRQVDARLLGGLGQLTGSEYRSYKLIKAKYRLSGREVVLTQIRVDGRRLPGEVRMGAGIKHCRIPGVS